ncbi:MAG: hypothetical protein JWO09_2677 [Bacteroidetes bacterium]|nr:hypothetical protein [Bacteroidota bacterium]
MDKKFDIQFFNESTPPFLKYLFTNIDHETKRFLDDISSHCEVLIFSGIIRNFFIKHQGKLRDLDLVLNRVDDFKIENYFSNYDFRRNSLGGYKVLIKDLSIDIWELENTWALNNAKVEMELFNDYNLPNTVFFNFSAIAFNYNTQKFIASESFIKFLETKEIDLVLEENPLPQLCIVNTIYYKRKFQLEISSNLKNYYLRNFGNFSEKDYEDIQIKHFKNVLYSYNYLKTWSDIFSGGSNTKDSHSQP